MNLKRNDYSWAETDSLCWVLDGDSFIAGQVAQTNPLICRTDKGNIEPKLLLPRNAEDEDLEDLIDLSVLNEAELANAITQRYAKGSFQTYIGPSLIVVNPVIPKSNIYSQEVRMAYKAGADSPPHIYAIASEALRDCTQKSQTIIISGESGAGKTENAKYCMRFLTQGSQFEKKILQCNPILESFGNAKTQRNSNSSRFGKLIKMYFDHEQRITGASIVNYLLEKGRVTSQNTDERNFHIFYQFLGQANNLGLFGLTQNFESYEYLKRGGVFQMPKDQQNFTELVEALKLLNFNLETIFSIVSSILLLGNLQFEEGEKGCTIVDNSLVQKICLLLSIPEKELVRCLTTKTRQFVKNEIIDTPLSRVECINCQQTISRYIYDRLFTYLVEYLNQSLTHQKHTYQINILDIYGFEVFNVNSFEQLCINYTNEKLLQLYIQYVFKQETQIFANEGLQGFQTYVAFMDNQTIIDVLEKPPLGIFNILDDSCAVAGTDETFLSKIRNAYSNNAIVNFSKVQNSSFKIRHTPKDVEYNVIGFRQKNKDEINKFFQVLLSKSKNIQMQAIFNLQEKKQDKYLGSQIRQEMNELMALLHESDAHFVRCVKPNDHLQNTQMSQSLLLNQIRYLGVLETIRIRKEGYSIRKSYQQFYKEFGDMTNYTIYPLLIKADFKPLVIKMMQNYFAFTDKDVLFGFTLIFLKQSAYNAIVQEYQVQMEVKDKAAKKLQNAWICYRNARIYKDFLYRVKKMQACARGFLARRRFQQEIESIIVIQRNVKRYLERNRLIRYKRVAKVLQTYLKRVYALKYVIVEKEAIVKIQRFVRHVLQIRRMQRHQEMRVVAEQIFNRSWRVVVYRASTRIQRMWRGYVVRKIFQEEVSTIKMAGFIAAAEKAVVVIQKYMRGLLARQNYFRVRWAARYIQGYFRTKWLRDLFLRLKQAAITIQGAVRVFQRRTRMNRLFELKVLKPMEIDLARLKEQEFKSLHDNLVSQVIENEQENLNGKKIDLFSQIVDIEILADTSEVYDTLWTNLYKRCFKESYEKCNFLQTYAIGECHAYACSIQAKIYSWGWNDELQQGEVKINPSRINQVQLPFKVRVCKSGANHGCFLTYEGQLYQTDSDKPILKDVRYFDVCNDDMIAVDEQNMVYMWNRKSHKKPTELKGWTQFLKMAHFTQKIGVHQVANGLNFSVLLTTNGLIFSMGENSVGELGTGTKAKRGDFAQVEMPEKIVEVHCGLKHVICRSSLGKVYSWGWGQHGQLGLGAELDESTPKVVALECKALQVMAGMKQSIVLLENKRIFWWGSNGCLAYQNRPVELMMAFPAVRVLCSWSRTMSIVYVTFANCHKLMENNVKLKQKILGSLTTKWSESDIFSIDPPFCESLANYFTQMKKPIVKPNIKFASKIEHQQLMKQLQQNNNLLQENTQNSSYFSFSEACETNVLQQRDMQRQVEEQYKQVASNQKVKELKQSVAKKEESSSEQRLKQLREIKRKYECLIRKQDLSQGDREFMEMLRESELIEILQFIN